MRRPVHLTLLAIALTIGAPTLAMIATNAHAQSAAELEAARGLYKDGQDLEKKKDYAGALDRFKKVAEIKSTAIVRYHEGFCSEKIGKWIDALDFFARAQLEGQGDGKQKEAVDASRKAADALRPRVPKIRIKVTGTEASKAQVTVDGGPVSPVLYDAGIPVDVGKHTVELSGTDVAPDSKEVTLAEKESKEVAFEAKKPSAATPVPTPTPTPTPKPTEKPATTLTSPNDTTSTTAGASSTATTPPEGSRFGILFGAFIQSATPTGQIYGPDEPTAGYFQVLQSDGTNDTSASQWMKTGVAPELMVGFRGLPLVSPYISWSHTFFTAGDHSSSVDGFVAQSDYVVFGLMMNTNAHKKGFGLYADIAGGQRWTKTRDSTVETTLTSLDVRLKLGVAFKPSMRWTIVGYLWGALGNYGHLDYHAPAGDQSIDLQNKTTHHFIGVGAGVVYDLPIGK
jgi:hypothetical protein